MRPSRWLRLFCIWLVLATAVAGCQSPDLPTIDADQLIEQTAVRMTDLAGFQFDISRDGAPAYLDPDNVLSFRRATGAYVAPDKAAATVRVIGPGLITDVDVISIGQQQWQSNIATGAWEQLPENWGFNPAILFDEAVGLPAILTADMRDLQLTEPQKLADGPDPSQLLYHLTGTVDGQRLYQMSSSLIGPEAVAVQLWIAPETFELVRVLITEPEPEEPSLWQVDFSHFGQLVSIEPPLD